MTSWPGVPIRRLFRIINGGTPTSSSENWDGEIRWATPVDLASVNGGYIYSTTRTLSLVGLTTGSTSVPAGSLILSTRAPIGYVAETTSETAFNQGCRGLVPIAPLDTRFHRYQLSSLAGRLAAQGLGSTFMELSTESLASTEITAPPVATQRVIADFLDAETTRIDAIVARKSRLSGLLSTRRRMATSVAVSGNLTRTRNLVPSSLSWLDERPADWDEVLLRLVADLGSGHTPSREHPEWWLDCTIPWITTGEVERLRADQVEYVEETREMISAVGLVNSSAEVHPAGTVVLCRTASAGYSGIMRTDMATSQDFATWTCGPLLRPRFLLLCLRAMRDDLLGRLAQGSTHQTIYMPDIRSIRIPLPSVEEQDVIVDAAWDAFGRIDRATALLGRQIDLLREHRQALITAAVTGEMEIPGMAYADAAGSYRT